MNLNRPQQNSIQVLVITAGAEVAPELIHNTIIEDCKLHTHTVAIGNLTNLKRKARALRADVVVYDGDLTKPAHLDYLLDLLQSDLHLPMIAVTQQGTHAIASEVLAAGCDDYFEKNKSPHLATLLPFSIIKAQHKKTLEYQCQKSLETVVKAQKTKDDFMAVMNHEVRTPMNSIIGFTDLLLDFPQEESQRDYLEIIKGNAYTLLEIINNVLTYSRLDSTAVQLEHRETDLTVLLEEIRETFAEDIQHKGLTLTIDIAPELPTELVSDYNELRQVIYNLTSNAIKFTHSGSIGIEVKGHRNFDHHNPLQWTYICSVRDTGIGIEEYEQRHIFDIFKQIDSTSTRKFGGTGLGLAICKKIAELLDGEIWLESEPEKGSTFHFSFQASLANPQTPENRQPKAISNQRNQFATTYPLKILLIQSPSNDRKTLESNLDQMGYPFTVVETSLEALKTIEKESFDIALMDVSLLTPKGMEHVSLMRQGHQELHQQALFIGALICLQQPYVETQDAPYDAFLSKPIDGKQLQNLLMKASARAKTLSEQTSNI